MRWIILFLISTLILLGCADSERSIEDYANADVKFQKRTFTAKTNEFYMTLPAGWHTNQDLAESDTLHYYLEAGSDDGTLLSMTVLKMETVYGRIDKEFNKHIAEYTKAINVTLKERTTVQVGNMTADAALCEFDDKGKVILKEIDLFIPLNNHQYYSITMICENNDKVDENLAIMMSCAKSFRLKN